MRNHDTENVKEELRTLDGILPESIDRRTFFKGSLATLSGGLLTGLAGCTGGGGGGEPETVVRTVVRERTVVQEGDGIMQKRNIIWRQPWKAEPAWAPAFIADLRGYWLDAGVAPPTVLEGFGSPDTARRVGTGVEPIGHSSISTVVPGLAQGYNLTFVGMTKQRSILGLVYRPDLTEDPTNLNGKRVGLDEGIGQSTWPLWPSLHEMDESTIETTGGTGEVLATQLGRGNVDAVWTTLDDVGPYQNAAPSGVTIEAEALYKHLQVPGYPLFVNTNWYNNQSDGVEYMSRLLEGYSEAMKWWLLNPGEMIDLLRNDINESLQTVERDQLLEFQRFNIANAISEVTQEKGLAALDEAVAANAITELGPHLTDNPANLPDPADIIDTEPTDTADLATLSSDELSQVEEFAGETLALYE